MKRRKQIGKLIYTPKWNQGDVQLGEDYESLSRDEKLEVLSCWISELLSIRNAMIPNPKSWHHFMGDKSWHGLTVDELITLEQKHMRHEDLSQAIETKLKEKNT